jgi:acyl-CoA synthetase (AMP-forming)/AMP-acid ligase II
MNPLDRPKPGSIGKPLSADVEVRFAEDGEMLLKSPCLFSGYHNDPATTAEVLRDGWLHTGDVAHADEEGFIFITGRKKELIVSSTGKKIYPSRVEALFKMEPLISQVLLIGDRLPFLTAIFTLNLTAAEALKGMEQWKGRPASEVAAAGDGRNPKGGVSREQTTGALRAGAQVSRAAAGFFHRKRRIDSHHEAAAESRFGELPGRDRGVVCGAGVRDRQRCAANQSEPLIAKFS